MRLWVEAEALLATHWDAGYEEGVKQQRAEVQARLRQGQRQSKQREEEAYARGKKEHAESTQARLLREQAERRLLAHRADEARQEQKQLVSALDGERQKRDATAVRNVKLEQRLRGASLPAEAEEVAAQQQASFAMTLQRERERFRAAQQASAAQHWGRVADAQLSALTAGGGAAAAGAAAGCGGPRGAASLANPTARPKCIRRPCGAALRRFGGASRGAA